MTKAIFAIALISIFTCFSQAHTEAACPDLSGDFKSQDGKQIMKITVSKVPGGLKYSFGEGSVPVVADGARHPIETGNYIAVCEAGRVSTAVSFNGAVVINFSHAQINAKGDIRSVSSGMDVSDVTWIKQ